MIIYGGCGALGRHLVDYFKKNSYDVISVDRMENAAADQNIIVLQETLVEQGKHVIESLESCGEVDGNF